MKNFGVLLLVLLAAFANAERATYKLTVKGKSVGTLLLEHKFLPGGKLSARERLETTPDDGPKFVFDNVLVIASNGRSETSKMTIESAGNKAVVDITFDAKGANIKVEAAGKKTTKSVAMPKGSSTIDPSVFWFLRDKPKVGAKVTYAQFDPLELKWVNETVTYKGPVSITFKGKKTTAHLLVLTKSKQWLDDKGMPYRFEYEDGMVGERQ